MAPGGMSMKNLKKAVIVYQSIGFILVIALLWLNELVDLPHVVFNAPATPANWLESLIESVGVLILGITVITITRNDIRKIKYLEGFLPVCSFCKRIRIDEKWIPIEVYISDNSEAVFSHGYCPECAEKYFNENMDVNDGDA